MLATSRHSPWTHSTFWTSLWAPIVTAGTHRFPKATTPLFLAKTAVSRLKTARLSGRNATPVLVLQYLTTSRTALCYDCWSDLRSKDIPVHENESLVNSQLRFEHKQHWCRSCWSHHNVLDLMPERTVPRVSTCRITTLQLGTWSHAPPPVFCSELLSSELDFWFTWSSWSCAASMAQLASWIYGEKYRMVYLRFHGAQGRQNPKSSAETLWKIRTKSNLWLTE